MKANRTRRETRNCLLALGLLALGCSGPLDHPEASPPPRSPSPTDSKWSLDPPPAGDLPVMGYNTFHDVGCVPDEWTVRARADALIQSGMKDAGYTYVNLDDGWMDPSRDANGELRADPARFQSGMKALTDYLHARGLKAGIYLTAGQKTYADLPGSLGMEQRDADKIAEWGFDLLKYDYRVMEGDPPNRDPKAENLAMSNALRNNRPGRRIVFSMCEHGRSEPWQWANGYAAMWRVSTDIKDIWDGEYQGGWSFNKILDDRAAQIASYSGPGHLNDYDMLVVGLYGQHWMGPGMTDTDYRSHFSLWCLLGAPLIHGVNPAEMNSATRDTLMAAELIQVDQDPSGSARRIRSAEGLDTWVRKLADGSWAVGLYNRTALDRNMTITAAELGLPAGARMDPRDLWARADLGSFTGEVTRWVKSHECVVLKIWGWGR